MNRQQIPQRRRRKEARPGELIEAGLAEFAEKGFAATRLEDVARRAGVAKGTIYRYFDGKGSLFVAAVRSRITPVLGDVEEVVDRHPGPTGELLESVLGAIYERIVSTDAPVLIRIIIAESPRFPDLAAVYHREIVSRVAALLRRIVERGIARGEFRAGPVLDAPLVLIAPAMLTAIWRMTFDHVEPVAVEKMCRAHADLVLNGLLQRTPGRNSVAGTASGVD